MISADILKRLAALRLSSEAMTEVLTLLAEVAEEAQEEHRKSLSAERSRRYRQRHSSVTASVTERDAGHYAFEHGCVRLTQHNLDQWVEAFPRLSVPGELIAMEPWLQKEGKRWFHAAANKLAKMHRETKNGHAEPPRPRFDSYGQRTDL